MHQLQFDLSRADQTAILQTARLAGDGVVSSRMLKGVLLQIDDYARQSGECFASQETIAVGMGCSADSVKRAVARLLRRSLITCELRRNRFGLVTNHYRIVWNELALLSDSNAGLVASNDRRSSEPSNSYASRRRSHGTADQQSSATIDLESSRAIGQSYGPIGQSAPAMGQSSVAMGQSAPQIVESKQPPSNTSCDKMVTENCLDDWTAARDALRLCGLKARKRAIELAKQESLKPSDVVAICEEYGKLYRFKLAVGAIFFRIEEGDWPIDPPPTASAPKPPRQPDPPPGDIRDPMTEEEAKLWQEWGFSK